MKHHGPQERYSPLRAATTPTSRLDRRCASGARDRDPNPPTKGSFSGTPALGMVVLAYVGSLAAAGRGAWQLAGL